MYKYVRMGQWGREIGIDWRKNRRENGQPSILCSRSFFYLMLFFTLLPWFLTTNAVIAGEIGTKGKTLSLIFFSYFAKFKRLQRFSFSHENMLIFPYILRRT